MKVVRKRAPALFSRRSFLILAPLAFAVFYFVSAVNIESPPARLQVTARAFPMVVGAALILSAIVIVVQELRQSAKRAAQPEAKAGEPPESVLASTEDDEGEGESEIRSWRDFWLVAAALLAMILLLDDIGFVLAATTLVAGLAVYFERRHVITSVVAAAVYAIVLYYFFDSVFEIYLPNGPLPW